MKMSQKQSFSRLENEIIIILNFMQLNIPSNALTVCKEKRGAINGERHFSEKSAERR